MQIPALVRSRRVLLALALLAPAAGATPVDAQRDKLADELLAECLPGGTALTGGDLFRAALEGEAFESGAVGPFDVHVAVTDELSKRSKARKLLDDALRGLQPAADALSLWYSGDGGVVSGRRFPIVLVESRLDDDQHGFERLLALLDRCEDQGYSGFKPDVPLFTADNRQADDVFTWEVLCCNVAHAQIANDTKKWLAHGLGFAALNLVVNRLFAKGAWGPPPPWLKEGLVDELDIEAYGEAWVAAGESTSFTTRTAGWSRKGWEGFVPEGSQPPPPVFGPPPGLSSRTQQLVSRDDWLDRRDSRTRHWKALLGDLRSDVPVSFRSMAAGQTYTPRDRAYSRCVLNLVIDVSEAEGHGLLAALDVPSKVARSGMRDGDPLAVVFARALGGVPAVDELQQVPLGEFLARIGRDDLVSKIERLGGGGMLALADHRAQADWLYGQSLDGRDRQALFLLIAEAEGYRQLQQWELLGDALDRGAVAALDASSSFPVKEKARVAAREAFREALGGQG